MHLQPVRPREGRDSRPVRKVAESEISKWWTIAVQHDNPDGQKLFPWHVLRLPQIKREHIGDAVHPKSDRRPAASAERDIGASLFNDR
jgi:hypothetical protein